MITAMPKFQIKILMSAGLVSSLLLSSCVLPPRQAWQRIKDEGVMRALFLPRSRQLVDQPAQLAAGLQGTSAGTEARSAASTAPVAEPFPGRPGFVYSPRTTPKKLVNVRGFAAGEQVLCPYTMEPFIVPDLGQGNGSGTLARNRTPATAPASASAPKTPSRSMATSNPAVVEVVSNDPGTPLLPEPPPGPAYGTWVEGKPGFVYSPYAAKHQLVDVAGIAAGVEVKCPYSGRIFRVPELSASTPAAPLQVPALPEAPDAPATAPGSEPAPSSPAPAEEKPSPGSASPAADGPVLPAPAPSSPSTDPAPSVPATPPAEPPLPTAQWVEGQLNLVQSPFGKPGELVDVAGRAAGEKVVCPYTGKAFLVPAKNP